MTKDIIWNTFINTGDPNAYLLFKEMENIKVSTVSEEKQEEKKANIS